jgi:hypothetical protein
MSKKNFRAVSQEKPRYPKPSQLTQSSLRKLGLAALGGLLLSGTAGISRAQAEEAKSADSAKSVRSKPSRSGMKKGKPAKDVTGTSAPHQEPRFMPNGGKPAPRIVEVGDSTDEKATPPKPGQLKGKQKAGTGTSTDSGPVPPPLLGGAPRPARMPVEEKSPPASKGEGTAGKTDREEQPEVLPTAGVPPLPRNPEPAPAPKKSK